MKKLIKLVLLLFMLSAAAACAVSAYATVKARPSQIPEAVYATLLSSCSDPECYLGESGGYVAVFADRGRRKTISITDIELSALRSGDRAMLEKGIPVADERSLLSLLEDLGS